MSGSKASYQRARRAAIKAGTWNPRGGGSKADKVKEKLSRVEVISSVASNIIKTADKNNLFQCSIPELRAKLEKQGVSRKDFEDTLRFLRDNNAINLTLEGIGFGKYEAARDSQTRTRIYNDAFVEKISSDMEFRYFTISIPDNSYIQRLTNYTLKNSKE